MKLKLKLTRIEMESMCSLLCATCEQFQKQMEEGDMEMEDKLYKAVFDEMYVKLLKKQFDVQKTYQIELKPSWAIAFHVQFSGFLDRSKHEGNLAQGICDRIHQHFH
jgi:hypothetical protein